MKKIVKLFGLKILEIDTYQDESLPFVEPKRFGGVKGEVLEYTPEEYAKDKDKELEKKYEKV